MKISANFLHWLPRLICILAISFISLFALDAFAPGLNIWQQLVGFMMHLIPSFVLIIFLIIAWRWELAGGIIFALIGIIMTPFIYLHNRNINHFSISQCLNIVLMITFPFIIVGVLFILSFFKAHKQKL